VEFEVTNPNKFPVKITGVTVGAVTVDKADCAASNVVVADPAGLLPFTVPAKQTVKGSVPDAISMIPNAADACQGAKFTVALTLAGESAAQ
jgi:hypothetical protein